MPRPKGRKNNKTLMQEETIARLTKRAHGYLIHEVQGVLETVVQRARDGDMTAAKLVLERAIPARRSIEDLPGMKSGGITINIVNSEAEIHENGRTFEGTADPLPLPAAEREAGTGPQGGEVFPEHGGEEGEEHGGEAVGAGLNTH